MLLFGIFPSTDLSNSLLQCIFLSIIYMFCTLFSGLIQASAYEACMHAHASECDCMHTPLNMPKMLDVLKKAHLLWLKRLQGVWQISHLKQQCFLSFTFYITQRSYEKIVYLFVVWLVQWWKLYYIYIFFTQKITDFDRLKTNMSDGTIVFLTSLLIAITWNILLLFSFWQKIISCFE